MNCLNFDSLKERLRNLLRRYQNQVDFLSLRVEESQGTNIVLRGDRLETLSEALALGGQVRACHRGGWGFATFNDLDTLGEQIETAIAAARWVGTAKTLLAPIEIYEGSFAHPISGQDPRHISLQQKKALCDHYNHLLQTYDSRITTTTVRYNDSHQHLLLATSEGTLLEQSWYDLELRFAATARNGDTVQTGRETTGSRRGYEDLVNLEPQVLGAAQRAVRALDLATLEGKSYPVVIDPILTGLFVHEAFGHLSEADMLYENPDLLEVMSLGKQFGPQELQIFDGAAPPGHRGSYAFDDEGVPATTTQLIHNGALVGRLHSRETAGKLAETATGNARCLNYHYPPLVRMTNTWIERGTTPVASLCDGIAEGVFARNWLGGMTNGEMFTFSAGEAWMIRHGELAEQVKDVTLSGNVFKTLANIEAIGDDFYWDESGGCGKGGQSGLAVGCGGPSLRLREVIVGGEVG